MNPWSRFAGFVLPDTSFPVRSWKERLEEFRHFFREWSWDQGPGFFLGLKTGGSPNDFPFPLSNESGRIHTVGSGEILNAAEIRRRLEGRGHSIEPASSLTVVPHLAESPVPDWEHGLRGGFALAVWDSYERRLRLSRDRFGIRTLFWTGDKDGIAFASDPVTLRRFLAVVAGNVSRLSSRPRPPCLQAPSERPLDPGGLRVYLDTGCFPPGETLFQDLKALPPGHYLEWSPENPPVVRAYWKPTFFPKRALPLNQAIDRFRESFETGLDFNLGNVDSPGVLLMEDVGSFWVAVTALEKSKGSPTLIIPEWKGQPRRKQSPFTFLSERYPAECRRVDLEPPDEEGILRFIGTLAAPHGDPAAWVHHQVERKIEPLPDTLLLGTGCDELWGGRPYHTRPHSACFIRRKSRKSATGPAEGNREGSPRSPAEISYERFLHVDPSGKFWNRLLHPEYRRPPYRFPVPADPRYSAREQVLQTDLVWRLPVKELRNADPLRDATALRFPWLDPVLFQTVAHFPDSLKVNGKVSHWLLKKTVLDRFDDESASVFLGFGGPGLLPEARIGKWLKGPMGTLFSETVLAHDSRISEWMDLKELRRIFELHRCGLADRGVSLWRVLILELWLNRNDDLSSNP